MTGGHESPFGAARYSETGRCEAMTHPVRGGLQCVRRAREARDGVRVCGMHADPTITVRVAGALSA